MIFNNPTIQELNEFSTHMLKSEAMFRGQDEVYLIVEDFNGKDCEIFAKLKDGVVIDISEDYAQVPIELMDEFREYLGELENIYTEIVDLLDPLANNDNIMRG